MARKPRPGISPKLRFEIFKRDKFTCQYCGRAAPDVLLQVDHIQPVSKEGATDLLNLITSCKDCNAGKGNRELSDDSILQKQKAQLDELQARREQIEMMLQWQKELIKVDADAVSEVALLWQELVPGYQLNDNGLGNLKRIIQRFGITKTVEAMRLSAQTYLVLKDGKATSDSVEKSWDYVTRIAAARQVAEEKPYMQELYYIRGILRNRCPSCRQDIAMDLLEEAVHSGVSTDLLKRLARNARNWSQWQDDMRIVIKEAQEVE
jgi:hypothetical protein